jgi:sigma-B regulation protein RsbU (phosphoserine phosphatase)
VPARSVGGDFYDFVIDGDRLWFVVADVAGKGMGAALMMAVALTFFRAIVPSQPSVAGVLAQLNRELARDNDRAMFITALAGCLDLTTGRVQLGNAGHTLPYRLAPDGRIETLSVTNSVALGVVEDARFPLTEVLLQPRDALVCYTDGVCDAVDRTGLAFGTTGLEACLRKVASARPDGLVSEVFGAIERFADGAAQADDITVAVLRYEHARGAKS